MLGSAYPSWAYVGKETTAFDEVTVVNRALDADAVRAAFAQSLQRIMSHSIILLGTKDEANRRIFIRVGPMLACIIQIQIHLSGIRMRKFANFQIDDDKAAQSPMKEE